ncbi:MAG: cell wall hydrolase [Alphaproteobacteria bacterium]|nr:cell wall hydrolase [Alphaproteobacteria bacterium]
MQLTIIPNPDASASLAYQIARVVYAQTGGTSLRLVEAMTTMIRNLSIKTNRSMHEIIRDMKIFSVLDESSPHHERLTVPADSRHFQMCVRTAKRMLSGMLPDCCNGATAFHHADILPDWAIARGYIADIDNVLFYL